MKKILVLFFCSVLLVRATDPLTATITADTKLEFIKNKGAIGLKKGTPVTVISKDGDTLEVVYRNIQGRVPLNKTSFTGDLPNSTPSATPALKPAVVAAPVVSPTPSKPADPKPAPTVATTTTPVREPQSMYGKMVKKARDNESKHKDNLVTPTNEVLGEGK